MRAAAAHGQDPSNPKPPELVDWNKTQQLGIPLAAGGLMEQPYKRTNDMLVAKNVYDAFRSYRVKVESETRSMSAAEFVATYPDTWDLICKVDALGDKS